MAYDPELADRILELLSLVDDVTEKKMFGGLSFLVRGHMTVVASGQGGLMVRLDPELAPELLATTPAQQVIMRNREMRGWLRVQTTDIGSDDELDLWVKRSLDYAATLPPK